MNTEMYESRDRLLYDASCRFCRRAIARLTPMLRRRGIGTAPLQEASSEMVLIVDGQRYGGADAILEIGRKKTWSRLLVTIITILHLKPLLRFLYRKVASNRHCLTGTCDIYKPSWLVACGPLVILPTLAIAITPRGWIAMWTLAFAIWCGCKWLTFWMTNRRDVPLRRQVAYLFAWPGMDAETFLRRPPLSLGREGRVEGALLSITAGILLLWFTLPTNDLATALRGLLGLGLLLHFGFFKLLALTWQRTGINASSLMHAPFTATSLREFWGRRWNRGFTDLTRNYIFAPLHHRLGARAAAWICFIISGLVHDLVLSLPAGGGYGLPTLYFLLQAAACDFERTLCLRGWLFTMTVVVLPSPLLFHLPFINNVLLPFMEAIGAR